MAISKLVMDFETTKGIDPSSPKPIYLSPAGETGLSVTRQSNTDDVIGGDIDSGGEQYGTSNEVSGSTNFPMDYEKIGYLLKAMFGGATTTGTGPYTHVFTSTVDALPTFLFQETGLVNGVTQVDRYNGLIAKSIGINVSPSGDYNVSFSTVGMKHRDSMIDGITELDETNKVVLTSTRIKNEQTSLLVDGTSFPLAKDFSFNYDRNSTAESLIGSGLNAGDVYAQAVKTSGSLSSLFDTGLYTKAKAETPLSLEVKCVSGTNSLSIKMGEVVLSFKRESKKKGEKYPVNADYTAYKNSGTEQVKVTLVNSISAY